LYGQKGSKHRGRANCEQRFSKPHQKVVDYEKLTQFKSVVWIVQRISIVFAISIKGFQAAATIIVNGIEFTDGFNPK